LLPFASIAAAAVFLLASRRSGSELGAAELA
jgi:hypothetical protein